MKVESNAAAAQQMLSFHAAGEDYAVNLLRVREIIPFEEVTRLPGAPAAVRGVASLRGEAVPVVDWAAALGLPETPVTKLTCIVLVETELAGRGKLLGVMADAVNQVLDVAAGDVRPVPAVGTSAGRDYLDGMVETGKKFTLLLDIEKALAPLVAGAEVAA
jgi:purine-binding chemotaxis protein CheW